MKHFLITAIVAIGTLPLAVQANDIPLDLNPLAKYQAHRVNSAAKAEEIQTNMELTTDKPFTLMLITQQGGGETASSPIESAIRQWIYQPSKQPMIGWRSMANVREYAANDPLLKEHHQHLLSKHRTLPVIALVDSRGGDWCSLSGSQLPGSEYELGRILDIHWSAIAEAAANHDGRVRMMSGNELNTARGRLFNWNNRGPNPPNGPSPFQPPNDNPFHRPRIFDGDGLVNIPDHYNADVQTGLDRKTRILVACGIVGFVLCGLLIFAGVIIAAAIRAFGQTDPDDDDMIINQPVDDPVL